jgi:hypothetical protein
LVQMPHATVAHVGGSTALNIGDRRLQRTRHGKVQAVGSGAAHGETGLGRSRRPG